MPTYQSPLPNTSNIELRSYLNQGWLLQKPIALLDIETLSLRTDGVVTEIGIVVTNIIPKAGTKWSVATASRVSQLVEEYNQEYGSDSERGILVFNVFKFDLEITEQVLKGRHVDAETVRIRNKWLADRKAWFIANQKESYVPLYDDLTEKFKNESSKMITCSQAASAMENIFADNSIEEIWMNHTSFDIPRLQNLFYGTEVNQLPWHYRKEQDIASIKTAFRFRCKMNDYLKDTDHDLLNWPQDLSQETHDSIGDCLYNMAVLSVCLFGKQ